MVANTGTYLDSPFHFHADGTDVAAVPLERVAEVPIVMIRASRLSWVDAREASSLPRIQSSANRAAADDNPLLRMATRPLASPPLPLEHLARL